MIIGLTGYARSGKDSLADYMVDQHGFKKYSFADPIKKGVQAMFGFSDDQLWGSLKDVVDIRYGITPRDMLQIFGTEVMQSYIPNLFPAFKEKVGRSFWAMQFENLYHQDESTDYVISDVRFPHEVDMIHRLGGKVYRVVRDKVTPEKHSDLHESEALIESLDVENDIDNNHTLSHLFLNWEMLFSRQD